MQRDDISAEVRFLVHLNFGIVNGRCLWTTCNSLGYDEGSVNTTVGGQERNNTSTRAYWHI